MPTLNPLANIGTITKPNLVVFFVIDCSYSMSIDGRMNSVNHAIREAIPVLKGIGGSDADLKIAVLKFSNGAEWMYNELTAVEDFTWNDIEPFGYTDFGAACNELNSKLSRKQFMDSQAGYKKPVVILLSDGEPTDDDEWPEALDRLRANKWFQLSIKIALAVDSADEDILAKFVGNPEGVYKIDDTQKLKKLIKIVAVKSAEIGSRSMPIDVNVTAENRDDAMEAAVHEAIQNDIDNDLYATSADDDWDDEDWED
jgi:uncharacterized protein YegL